MTHRRRRTVPDGRSGLPSIDADLHAYVLARLDAHLAELHTLRRELAPHRPIRPGARWRVAAATLVAARHYARDIARALGRPAAPAAGSAAPAAGSAAPAAGSAAPDAGSIGGSR
jgi:hypothetical protein